MDESHRHTMPSADVWVKALDSVGKAWMAPAYKPRSLADRTAVIAQLDASRVLVGKTWWRSKMRRTFTTWRPVLGIGRRSVCPQFDRTRSLSIMCHD